MKKELYLSTLIVFITFMISLASATEGCNPSVTLLNQDPYPAVPGDYVDVVFQIDGLDNPLCGQVTFDLRPKYPFLLDTEERTTHYFNGGSYLSDFESFALVPYRLRVDSNALDGANEINVRYGYSYAGKSANFDKSLDIEIEDSRSDFEVVIDEYSFQTKRLEVGILNIGKKDVEALTIEIPKQDNIEVQGSNKKIVGDLDSNEDTTISFDADIKEGEIKVIISYNDNIGQRRTIEKDVSFSESSFASTRPSENSLDPWAVAFWVLLIIVLVLWFIGKRRERRKRKMKK